MPAIATATIQRSAVPQYPYSLPEHPDFVSLGLQSIIQFNGLNMNDRLRPDRYMISKITGLGQADIRDNRIPRPSDHGEIPYDSFYGGVTLTFEGKMEANSLSEIGRMESDLRAALGSLVESPMKFTWWDVHDDFSDGVTSQAFWTPFMTGAATFPSDRTMRISHEGVVYHNLRKYVDSRIGAQVVVGSPIGEATWGIAAAIVDSENYLKFVMNVNATNEFSIKLAYVSAGVETQLSNPVTISAPRSGQSIWLALQQIGDTLIGNAYVENPLYSMEEESIASITATINGSIANKFGFGVGGMAGVFAKGNLANWIFQDFRVDSIWPGDFFLNVKPVTPLAPAKTREGTTTKFLLPFMFAVRASNPRICSPVILSASMGSTIQPTLGRIYPHVFSQFYTVPINELGQLVNPVVEQQAICSNKGSWLAQTKLKIRGGITSPIVTNLTTGQRLAINGSIAENDFLVIDCADHTIVNSSGASQFGVFDPSSQWLQLTPGDNRLILTGTSSVGGPTCTVMWKHTWI